MDKNETKWITEIEQRSKSNSKRLDEVEKSVDELKKTYSIMEKMDLRVGNIETAVATINGKLDKQSEEKGMKWDKLIDYLFYFLIALLLGLLVHKLGLK